MRRLVSEARFALRASSSSTRLADVDGVVASAPFVFNLAAARSYRAPCWLDLRDLTWEYARAFGSNSRFSRIAAAGLGTIALSCLRAARRVSTTTESQRRYLMAHGLPAHSIEVIPNGVPQRVVDELGRLTHTAEAGGGILRNDSPLKLVYAGLLGFPQGIRFLVETVAELDRRKVELHIFGDGVDRRKIESYCASRGVGHVRLHGQVDYQRYLEAIASADVLFASLRTEASSAMPSKIWEYMATGKPILFAGSGEAPRAIDRAGAGLSSDYGNAKQLQKNLRVLIADQSLRQQLGSQGREWVRRHRIREEINRAWVERIEEVFVERASNGSSHVFFRGGYGSTPSRQDTKRDLAVSGARAVERLGGLRVLEWARRRRTRRLAVLTYHRVVEDPEACPALVSASPARFEEQMAHVAAHHSVVSMEDVLESFRRGRPFPARSVLLTFDDAYSDFRDHAWPILKKYHLPATLFVPTGFPDRPERSFWWDRLYRAVMSTSAAAVATEFDDHALRTAIDRTNAYRFLRARIKREPHSKAMQIVDDVCSQLGEPELLSEVLSWDALRALAKDGVTLGPHTHTHPLLDRVPPEVVQAEVSWSVQGLTREIGGTLPIFAYPGGHFDDTTTRILANEGIELAFTTRGGVTDLRRACDPLRLRRIHVGARTTRSVLRAQLLGIKPLCVRGRQSV